MNNEGLYEFYWKYYPNNYFEQIINYKNQNYNFLIENGSISLEVNSVELKKDSEIVNSIYDIINCYFITQLIISYRPYLISFESATFGEKNDFFRQKLSFIEKYQNLHTEILPYDQIINTEILPSKYKFNDFIELIVRNKSNSILKEIIDLLSFCQMLCMTYPLIFLCCLFYKLSVLKNSAFQYKANLFITS